MRCFISCLMAHAKTAVQANNVAGKPKLLKQRAAYAIKLTLGHLQYS